MDKTGLIKLIHDLELMEGHYVVFGGGCLAIRGLRNLRDIDLFVTTELYKSLRNRGWQETSTNNRTPYLISNINGLPAQAFCVWEGSGWQPNIQNYLKHPEIIEDISFMPLEELYKWKEATRRPKDVIDLSLIEKYWAQRQ